MRGYCAVVKFTSRACDGCYYEVVWLGDVLVCISMKVINASVVSIDLRDRHCILSIRHSSCCLS